MGTKVELYLKVMREKMIRKLFSILEKNEQIEILDIENLVSTKMTYKLKRQFVDLLNSISQKEILKELNFLTSIIKLMSDNIKVDLKIILDKDNLIERLVLDPKTPTIKNLDELNQELSNFSTVVATGYSHNGYSERYTSLGVKSKFAIASLVKIIVAVIILEAVEQGKLDLNTYHCVSRDDISFLSSGISKEDIGKNFSIKDLLTYMLIASDNTAMDILIKILGHETFAIIGKQIYKGYDIELPLTKTWLEKAWCNPILEETEWRKRSIKEVVWEKGLDYYVSVDLLEVFVKKFLTYKWLPYDDLDGFIYKGGNAPGVLSGVWAQREKNFTDGFVYFIINKQEPLNVLEELYCYQCLFSFMNTINFEGVSHG